MSCGVFRDNLVKPTFANVGLICCSMDVLTLEYFVIVQDNPVAALILVLGGEVQVLLKPSLRRTQSEVRNPI